MDKNKQAQLKQIPGVDRILEYGNQGKQFEGVPKSVLLPAIRQAIDALRTAVLNAPTPLDADRFSMAALVEAALDSARRAMELNLKRTVNATGVVVHTNLGRSLLSSRVLENLKTISSRYSNLEFDLEKGRRGSRYSAVEGILCELSGAPAAMVVNNNAAAVLLCLDTLAKGREVIVSRGELVEIGGAFRIPDVMAKSGAFLKEVGATNRTHPRDYENAIGEQTGLLLKAHTSNYSIVGFTKAVSLADLVSIGRKHNLPVMEDLGSGTFVDFSKYGLLKEPTVQEALESGVDVVTFSGDKLLGGPQAGIILGSKQHIDRIKANPLTRALRIDKMTLAALEGTLQLYRDERQAVEQIPTLAMLTMPLKAIEARAAELKSRLDALSQAGLTVELMDSASRAGGGSLPLLNLPSCCVGVQIGGISANGIERWLRNSTPPVIGRIENDRFVMDPRTLQEEELDIIEKAFERMLAENRRGR
ncbi:L-seryl-tRNA(Sec) selenium transferase [Desulfosarcina widdelii]|uniref:L-seryl-tRNA(Sec) selenium transferase n=1 Tax=Desulfosarcina widdelii TaxID=947919 RepID=A0A5K7ZH83_9BACT|nr:L-seryl-tRNA(Sec) selenium transferase [Desulfosarcina widdelii]BBO79033.1 L-seryl-tRNA(Sec) selenium transferase [Desulfosarcina widdelii]